jgi:RNA polymerase-binding transcription factor DksA
MTKTDMNQYREKLFALGRRLGMDFHEVAGEAFKQAGGEASGNLSNTPFHLADLGTDAFEQEVALGLLKNEEQLLEEVAAALKRLDDGTFGICQECCLPIAPERLQAIPYTAYCVSCAQKLQRQ